MKKASEELYELLDNKKANINSGGLHLGLGESKCLIKYSKDNCLLFYKLMQYSNDDIAINTGNLIREIKEQIKNDKFNIFKLFHEPVIKFLRNQQVLIGSLYLYKISEVKKLIKNDKIINISILFENGSVVEINNIE